MMARTSTRITAVNRRRTRDATPLPPVMLPAMNISAEALMSVPRGKEGSVRPVNPWQIPPAPPGVVPTTGKLAMDEAPWGCGTTAAFAWAQQSYWSEGLGFLGYPYLAELSQRPEYRLVVETIARECTRKWIKLTGGTDEKRKQLWLAMKRYDLRGRFRECLVHDGFFGRGQIFIDTGKPGDDDKPLIIAPEKIGKGGLKNLKCVEPMWSYPGRYNSTNPLAVDYYAPTKWYVNALTVDSSRFLTIISHPMPDLLKPAYMFGGLAMTQMLKPYVDNWLRTRQSVSDLIHSFSTMVLSTDMSTLLQGGCDSSTVVNRAEVYTRFRDNRGLLLVDKATEELTNVSTSLASLDKLQAQALEQLAAIAQIPLVVLLGVTPAGLNASSEGEIRTFYARIHAYQERTLTSPIERALEIIQLSEFGAIDPEITFEFEPLWEDDAAGEAAIRKSDADADKVYIDAGVVSPEETRQALANEDGGRYHGVDLSGPPPEPPEVDEPGTKPAEDAAPRTMYVKRQVLNRSEVATWALSVGLPDLNDDLHVTIAYSTNPVDWMAMGDPFQATLEVVAGGPRLVEPLGDQVAVLLFASGELSMRNRAMREAGASWDHPSYEPHISLVKNGKVPPSVEPYRGRILLGPEIFEEVKVKAGA